MKIVIIAPGLLVLNVVGTDEETEGWQYPE